MISLMHGVTMKTKFVEKRKSFLSVWLCNTQSFILSGNRFTPEVSFWAKLYFHWRSSGLNKGRNSLHTVTHYFSLLYSRTANKKAQKRQVSERNSTSKSHILRRLRRVFRTYGNWIQHRIFFFHETHKAITSVANFCTYLQQKWKPLIKWHRNKRTVKKVARNSKAYLGKMY